jgi:hypothetical protein
VWKKLVTNEYTYLKRFTLTCKSEGGSFATHMQDCSKPSGMFFMYDSGGGSAEINTRKLRCGVSYSVYMCAMNEYIEESYLHVCKYITVSNFSSSVGNHVCMR